MRVTALFLVLTTALALRAADARLSRELQEYLKRPEAQVRVLDGALLICKEMHKSLDIESERKSLTTLATELKAALGGAASAEQQSDALARVLFTQQKFGLPERDDAAAFLLTDVLRNKRGNCLGLSILCLALAEETGLKLYGVPVPSSSSDSGHMFVRFDDGAARRNFDPVEKGAEHSDAYYQKEFKLAPEDLRSGYALGNAKKRDVLALLLVNLGGAYVEEGRGEQAPPLLEAALTLRPESAAAHSNLGAAKLGMGDLAGAEKSYLAALRIGPKYFPARIGVAEIALRKGDSSAQRMVEELVAAEPENVQARTMQASLQLQHNDLKGAIKTLNDLSALPAADVSVWNNLGKCYALSGDMTMSEVSYRRALVFDDRSAEAHAGLGRALMAAGKKADASAEIEAALKINPGHAGARAARAELTQAPDTPAKKAPETKPPQYPKGTTVLPFKLFADRIFVPLRLNDIADAEALVDTGSEVSLLNGSRVKLAGLRPVRNEELVGDMVGRVPVEMVSVDSIKMGDTIVRNQALGRIEGPAGTKFERIDFVLGMDVLSKMRFSIDFERAELILWPTGSKLQAPQAGIERINLSLVKQVNASPIRPCIVATVNQKNSATFLVDTGSDGPMFVAFKKPSELGFGAATGTAMAGVYDGTRKLELPVSYTTFSTFEFGKTIFKDIEGRVVDASAVNSPIARGNLMFLNVIGTPFLKAMHAIHFDIAGRTMAIDRLKSNGR